MRSCLVVNRGACRREENSVGQKLGGLIGVLLCTLIACRSVGILQGSGQERVFREHYVEKSFYTAMVIQPYRYNEEYLIDLTGSMADVEAETLRAATAETLRTSMMVPLGTPITIIRLDHRHVLARIAGQSRLFRILVRTQSGTLDDLARELALVVSQEPPLPLVRPEMRPFVERQEVTRGMSQREVPMSWGLPDKIISVPGSAGPLEEWLYFSKRVYLFLDNGLVTNWQQF